MAEEIKGYCLKCKEHRIVKDPKPERATNGSPATRGTCTVCGTNMYKRGATAAHEGLAKPDPSTIARSKTKAKAKSKKKSAPDEDYFLDHVAKIDTRYSEQSVDMLMSMAGALMGIGKRTKALNAAALDVANKIGPIDFDPDGRCDPMDISKHLTSDYVVEKLGI